MKGRIRPPGLPALFTLVFTAGGWCAALVRLSDNSFLWHLRTGHLILDRGIPRSDPYSFAVPGVRWVAQSWLAEVLYGLIDNVAGAWGLRLLSAFCGALTGWLVYRVALRLARNRLSAAVLTLVALRTILTIWSERPLLFGLLGMLVLVWAVEVPESWAGRHAVLTIPVTIWLFANLHGTWVLGVGYVALHVLGRWAEGAAPWEGRERLLTLATAAGTASVVLNPYGLDLLLFPVRLVMRGDTLGNVVEWSSPDFRSAAGMIFGVWILGFVVIAVLGRHRPGRRDVIVALPFLFMALWALRNIGVATVVMLPVMARALASEADRPDERSPIGWIAGAALVAFAFAWTANAAGSPSYDLRDYPVSAMRRVAQDGLLGSRVLTTDAWAGYTIAKYWPAQHVFMDDRYDMYPKAIVDDYVAVADLKPGWQRVLDEHRIEVIVWPRERGLTQALKETARWHETYHDRVAAVFVRTGRDA